MVVAPMNDTQFKVDLVFRVVAMGGLMLTSWMMVRKMLNMLEPPDTQNKSEMGKLLLKHLNVDPSVKLTEYELVVAGQLIQADRFEQGWNDIGGMDSLLREVNQKLLVPLKHSHLFSTSRLASAPKGALFYGPPGCGKTMIARGIARQSGFRFMNLQMSFLLDKWYGESQKYTAAIFSVAKKLQPIVIFIDEVDSFLRVRDSSDHEATAMLKAEFMAQWDGMTTDSNSRIIIIGATNRPKDIDPAVRRRMPLTFFVRLPDFSQRCEIFRKVLSCENLAEDIDYSKLGELTEGLSGSDIKEICRQAVISQLNVTIDEGEDCIRPVESADLIRSITRGVNSVSDDFDSPENFFIPKIGIVADDQLD